ncbi:MAG: hypothetical protein QM599_06855 [Pseudoxanthomonas sp.]
MRDYKFSLDESMSGKKIVGSFSEEEKIKYNLPEAGFDKVERLFVLESHGCGGNSIDLVIQIGPGNQADIRTRDYYRIVFSVDLKSVVSSFYDPSISAANAVLPLQSVEGMPSPATGEKITCNDSVPTVQ